MYEVELKFPLDDDAPLLKRLSEQGARAAETIQQSDLYFGHPQRDFEQTDEALRIRSYGSANCVTYKGPVIDPQTKTRREIEVSLADGHESARQFGQILESLGFRPVREVRKQRTTYHLERGGRRFEICLDRVEGLGLYLEIETQAEEADRQAAGQAVLQLAAALGLSAPERRAYLNLLLAKEAKNPQISPCGSPKD